MNVIVVGHDQRLKCAVANALFRQKNRFQPFMTDEIISASTKKFKFQGETARIIMTSSLATPAWNSQFKILNKEKQYQNKRFVYVKDMTAVRVGHMTSIHRISNQSAAPVVVVITYPPNKKQNAEDELAKFSKWQTVLLNQEYSILEMKPFSKMVFDCIADLIPQTDKPQYTEDETDEDSIEESGEERMNNQIAKVTPKCNDAARPSTTDDDFRLTSNHWEIYGRALKYGQSLSYHTRVNVVGYQAAGKTTLIRRLQEIHLEKQESMPTTECLEINKTASRCMESNDGRIWERLSDGYETELNYQRMADCLNCIGDLKRNIKEYAQGEIVAGTESIETSTSESKSNKDVPIEPIESRSMPVKELCKAEYLTNVVRKATESPGLRRYISYWDFAGQASYYTTHQAFMAPNSVYLLVVDLSKQLDQEVDDSMEFRMQKYKKTTILDAVRFWAGSIKAFGTDESNNIAPIIIVGTHADKVNDNDKIESMFQEVKQVVGESDLSCIAINNTKSFENDNILQELKDRILDKALGIIEKKVAAHWICLEYKIILEKEKNNVIITFTRLEEINKELEEPLKNEDLLRFLEHEHCNGFLMYFNTNGAKNMVILQPAILANFINLLLRKKKDVPGWNLDGKFNQVFLENAVKGQPVLETYTNQLRELLLHLKVIFQREITERTSSFFMPALLGERPKQTCSYGEKCEKSPLIRISFEDGKLVPPAFFHSLAVSCMFAWKLDKEPIAKSKRKWQVFYHYIRFSLSESEGMLLEMYWSTFQIYVQFLNLSEITTLKDVDCLQYLKIIQNKVVDILKTYRHESIVSVMCLKCPVACHEESYVEIDSLVEKREARCFWAGEMHIVSYGEAISSWTKVEDRGHNTDNQDDLPIATRNRLITDTEFVKLSGKFGDDYQALFLLLTIDTVTIQQTLQSTDNSVKITIINLFMIWRKKMADEATVGNFLKVLPDLGINEKGMWDVFQSES